MSNLPVQPKAGIVLPNGWYDKLKPFVTTVLPALATLYAGLAVFWGFPKPVEVCGSITLFATFLGVIIGLSSRTFNSTDARYDGTLNVLQSDARLINQLDITTDPEVMAEQKEIILKVNKVNPPPPLDSPPRS